MDIQKRIVVDKAGNPVEVIIPFETFKEIEEMLGFDLEPEVKIHLKKAKLERENKVASYINLDEI